MKTKINQEERAFKAWAILTNCAIKRDFVTYKELGDIIGIHHRAVRYVLGLIQDYCMSNELPPLTILVNNKNTGKPGDGFIAWDIENSDDGVKKVQDYNWINFNNPFGYAEGGESQDELVTKLIDNPETASEIFAKVKVRGIAQAIFRKALLRIYDYSCCICGLSFDNVLEASHIISYSQADSKQRLEINNGLLLCANHHKMFDCGQITINQDYTVDYFDMAMNEGDYSEFDKLMTIKLNGKKIMLPVNEKHRPKLIYLKKQQDQFNEK
jgi:putative restriction endonuclease